MQQGARIRIVVSTLVIAAAVVAGGSTAEAQAPPTPEAGSSDWRQVSAGSRHTCGIRTTGRLYCWGNDSGELGDGGTDTNQPTPVQVAGGATDWTSVAAGFRFTCGLRATGRLYCWGEDSNGKLGNGGADTDVGVPTLVAGGVTNWTAVTAGDLHACARRATGRLYCWGSDLDGQLGDGGIPLDRSVPTLVAGGATNWTAVTAGSAHTCARRATGRLYCWGNDVLGQLGDGGTNTNQPTPVQVAGSVTNWSSVTAGEFSTCGRRANNRLYCWGNDDSGQVGDGGADTNQPIPVQVTGGGITWASVEAGEAHTCGRRITGRLYCWGDNFSGQIGSGTVGVNQPTAAQVAGGATDWHSVSAGGSHSCARTTTGRLFCWGADFDGQLGDGGTDTDQPTPVEVFAP